MRQLRKLKRRQILLLSLRTGSANKPTFLGSQKNCQKGEGNRSDNSKYAPVRSTYVLYFPLAFCAIHLVD